MWAFKWKKTPFTYFQKKKQDLSLHAICTEKVTY